MGRACGFRGLRGLVCPAHPPSPSPSGVALLSCNWDRVALALPAAWRTLAPMPPKFLYDSAKPRRRALFPALFLSLMPVLLESSLEAALLESLLEDECGSRP